MGGRVSMVATTTKDIKKIGKDPGRNLADQPKQSKEQKKVRKIGG